MFKTLWNSFNTPTTNSPVDSGMFDRAKMKMLNDYFYISKKLRYYPEYQREIVFDTIIVAYCVNSQFIYFRDDVLLDDDGFPTGFRVTGNKVLALESVKKFQLLVPDTTELEKTLNYANRAELGRAGQFRPGNAMTLVVETDQRSIPTVDTTVDRRHIMKGGPYEGSSTVLVTPDFETLILADKRRKQRVETAVRADLYLAPDAPPFQCVLGDFSEQSLRLQVSAANHSMPAMKVADQVIIVFRPGDAALVCRFRGRVFRRTDDFCVIDIEHLYKLGDFENVKAMDIMEIKAMLLNLRS